jgi:hypothetical protein
LPWPPKRAVRKRGRSPSDLTRGDQAAVMTDTIAIRVDTAAGEIRVAVTDPHASAEAVRRLDARRLNPPPAGTAIR